MSTRAIWQLVGLSFALIVIGIFVAADIQKVVGVVIVCIGVVPAFVARLARQNQRRAG